MIAPANDDQVLEATGDEQLPPSRKPRSPVRRYAGPSGGPARRASKSRRVSSGRFQYPAATLPPATQISPMRPGGHATPVSGSAIRTCCSSQGRPQLTSRRTGASPATATSCRLEGEVVRPRVRPVPVALRQQVRGQPLQLCQARIHRLSCGLQQGGAGQDGSRSGILCDRPQACVVAARPWRVGGNRHDLEGSQRRR